MNVAALRAERAKSVDKLTALQEFDDLTPEQVAEWDAVKAEIKKIDAKVTRALEVQEFEAGQARPVGETGGEGVRKAAPGVGHNSGHKVYAKAEDDPYKKDPSLIVGAMIKMVASAKGDVFRALDFAEARYGADHEVTRACAIAKALNTTSGSAGGFVVPPEFVEQIIPLLYNKTAVRKAGCVTMPMPNGTMTVPKMTGGSQAYWVGEGLPIGTSQPSFGQIVATAHKLAALVPITNDQLKYAVPTFDAMVRDDLATQIALAEDSAFLRGNGLQFMPKGLDSIVLASNQKISNATPTFGTINTELTQLVTTLENANIPMDRGAFIMAPRVKNSLMNLQNQQGQYIYRDEMRGGTLNGYKFFSTAQIPTNLIVGPNADCSEIYFADFAQCMILEARSLEFSISTEAMFQDALGNLVSTFQNDMTLIRGILAEDFQVRYDNAVATLSGVRWGASGTGT